VRYDQKYIYCSSSKVTVILVRFQCIFLTVFRKTLKYQISLKYVQWEPICSMRTEMTKLIIAFTNFANTSNNRRLKTVYQHQPRFLTFYNSSPKTVRFLDDRFGHKISESATSFNHQYWHYWLWV